MPPEQKTSRRSLELPAGDGDDALLDEKIARLQRDLASQAAVVERLSRDLAARDGSLARARGEVAARDATISRLQAVLHELATTRQAARANRTGETSPSASDDEVTRLSAEIARLESAVQELHASTSWRVTAPLRGLKNAGLRLRAALGRVLEFRRPDPDATLVSESGLFDPEYYAMQAPEVRQGGLDPITHYLRYGATAGLDPHPLFDGSFYLAQDPEVARSGENPLLHYLRLGAAAGRDPHPLFDTRFYWEQNPELAGSGENPLAHYLRAGTGEGRDPHPLFDTGFYLEQNPHVAVLRVNPLVHFVTEGPTEAFDPLSSPQPLPDTGVCIVTPDIVGPAKYGGIGTACYHSARLLAQDGHAVTILFTIDLSPCRLAHWRNTCARMGVKFLSLAEMPPVTHLVDGSHWYLERSWRVFKYLERKSYSVVHFQDWHANGFWSIKAKRLGLAFDRTTLTVTTHSPTKWQDDGMQWFGPEPIGTAQLVRVEHYAIEHCDVLLSPTHYMLGWLSEQGVHLPGKVIVTPNPYTESTRESRAIDVDNDHLIFFGRLETRKGVHVFAEALRRLRRDGGFFPRMVSFLGTPVTVNGRLAAEYLDALRTDLSPVEVRVISNLDHHGALEYIEQSRGLVVIPSLLDNCPYVVIESIENQIPFLAARTGGIPDMVDPRATFEPTSAALAERLAERHRLNHTDMHHPYSVREAARIWRDLHREEGPLGGPDGASPKVASDYYGDSPRVSICIPFFEDERYLATLLEVLANQSYSYIEIVVVNHGSGPDASREFDRVAAERRDPRFRFLTTENRGPGAARNAAAEAANGDLLLFLDADDLPKGVDCVASLVSALRRCGADCLTCPYDIVSADRLLPTEQDVTSTYRPWGACLEAGFFENVLGGAAMILPRSVFTRVRGFPTKRASWEIHEFLLRLSLKRFRLDTLPESLFFQRRQASHRDHQASCFENFQSLFDQLQGAASEDLARIIAAVGGPMLVACFGGAARPR
jgi:glycosyltransferase involved in cell wall biosynthesis/GT2 family glycosyltransferase